MEPTATLAGAFKWWRIRFHLLLASDATVPLLRSFEDRERSHGHVDARGSPEPMVMTFQRLNLLLLFLDGPDRQRE